MEEEIKLQISDKWGDKACPLDWNKLPSEVIDKIKPESFYNVLVWTKDKEIQEKTIVYFRQVKKFRKGIVEFVDGNITFGV